MYHLIITTHDLYQTWLVLSEGTIIYELIENNNNTIIIDSDKNQYTLQTKANELIKQNKCRILDKSPEIFKIITTKN